MDHTKIFIDTDNEITFILEKILNAKSERVSLIVPDRASILSSVTGLKLIKRVVDKSNKLLILVTLDDLGADLARKAGLYVVERIGEINEDAWTTEQKKKFEVIKKGIKSHYMPETVENRLSLSEISDQEKKHDDDTVSVVSLLNEIEAEEINEQEVYPIKDKEAIVPQVRINIDLRDEKQTPEILPTFLSSDKGNGSHQVHEDEIIETTQDEPVQEDAQELSDDSNYKRARRSIGRSSKISNLSFAVGKDIREKKKKIFPF